MSMIEASSRLLPPDPRWLDFAGFVAPIMNAGNDASPESPADIQVEDELELAASASDR